MSRFSKLATPVVSALFFLYATFLVVTEAPAATAAAAGLPLAVFLGLFGVCDLLAAAGWLAVARLASTGEYGRARSLSTVLLFWLVLDEVLSVTWWPNDPINEQLLGGMLGLGLFQVLYVATTLQPRHQPEEALA